MTPHELLGRVIDVCQETTFVSAYSVRTIDLDILSLRVHLIDESFVDVFYNTATAKTAFALISNGQRIYGKDNAKIGWHVHPAEDPQRHIPCESVSFAEFINEVKALRFS